MDSYDEHMESRDQLRCSLLGMATLAVVLILVAALAWLLIGA